MELFISASDIVFMHKIADSVAFALLKKYKIPTVHTILVKDIKQAQAAATKIGYPVVLKISADMVHKAKAGCVKTVYKESELSHAFNTVIKSAKKVTKKTEGMFIEPLLHGDELIIGGKRDPSFGTVVVFGSGGVLADVLKDVSFRVLPISRFDAQMMIGETRAVAAFPSLQAQESHVVDLILKVARLLESNPKIAELDINPLFLTAHGLLAADVRIIEKG